MKKKKNLGNTVLENSSLERAQGLTRVFHFSLEFCFSTGSDCSPQGTSGSVWRRTGLSQFAGLLRESSE